MQEHQLLFAARLTYGQKGEQYGYEDWCYRRR